MSKDKSILERDIGFYTAMVEQPRDTLRRGAPAEEEGAGATVTAYVGVLSALVHLKATLGQRGTDR